MTVIVRLICNACGAKAGAGLDVSHAQQNIREVGGRVFSDSVIICTDCARHT